MIASVAFDVLLPLLVMHPQVESQVVDLLVKVLQLLAEYDVLLPQAISHD